MVGIPKSGKCAVCGERVAVPIRCKYCGNIHCIDHHLPKDHNCPGLREKEEEPERIIIIRPPDSVSKGPADRPKKKKIITGIVVAVILSIIMFAVFQNFTTHPQTFYIEEEIALLARELGYDDEVAQYVARDVNNWTGFWGNPLLYSWKGELSNAKEKYEGNKLARVEIKITKKLSKKIKKEIQEYETLKWDLEDVIKDKEANCLGYTQLFFILGEVVGLPVEPVDVIESEESSGYGDFSWRLGASETKHNTHVACLVNLSNEQIVFVELSASSPVISKPLILAKKYEKNGTYMEAKYRYDYREILYYTRIRLYGKDGLISSIHNSRACDYEKMGDYEMAMSDYTEAIKIDPKNVNAYNNRGRIYISQGDYEMAISDYTRAIEIDPKFAPTYYNRGRIYKSLGEYRKAISDYTKVTGLLNPHSVSFTSDPVLVGAYYNRGLLYHYFEEYEKAIDDYTKVIYSSARVAIILREDAYLNRGRAYFALGKEQKAESDFRMAKNLRKLGGDKHGIRFLV